MSKEKINLLTPIQQLNLFGYESYFNFFTKLFEKKQIPNSILLSGLKGSGKSTFVYHLVNYLLSKKENHKYSITNFAINPDNYSYNLINNRTHPNLFLIENNSSEKEIKIDRVRNLLKFLNKTTYSRNIKIVMIDNAEYLNLSSSNSLLKAIEEPQPNTFFFIIHNSSFKILNTIKSRCTEFKIFFNKEEKKKILKNIFKIYNINSNYVHIIENFYFDTPGNLIKYLSILDNSKIDIIKNKLSSIHYFMNEYIRTKNPEILFFISTFVEKYYNDMCSNNKKNQIYYFFNRSKILNQINNIKKFNLNEKNVFILIKDLLKNESR